jgi:hypothetical protein
VLIKMKNYLSFFNLVVFAIGFYDGFFGPGTGSFFVLAFIVIKGANIMESTAITKLLNFSSNFAAFIIFAFQGYVIWYLGLTMAVAQIAGAYTGSKFAIKNGEKVVRPVLVDSFNTFISKNSFRVKKTGRLATGCKTILTFIYLRFSADVFPLFSTKSYSTS